MFDVVVCRKSGEHGPEVCRGAGGYIYVLSCLYVFTLLLLRRWAVDSGFVCPQVCPQVVDNWWVERAGLRAAAFFGACFPVAGCVG